MVIYIHFESEVDFNPDQNEENAMFTDSEQATNTRVHVQYWISLGQ